MRKKNGHLLLIAFLLMITFQVRAQENKHAHLRYDKVKKAQATEKRIREFIQRNISGYKLSPEREKKLRMEIAAMRKDHEGHTDGHENKHDLTDATLLAVKEQELRWLYFNENPDEWANFATESDSIVPPGFVCDNGGFESGYDDNYYFKYLRDTSPGPYSCNMSTSNLLPYAPNSTPDTPLEVAGLVSPGYDSRLASLATPVLIDRVRTGERAIKLNNNSTGATTYGYDVTSMSKRFIVNSNIISFSFSLIVQDPSHGITDQPHFIVRLYDKNDVLVDDLCIVADVDDTDRFQSVMASGYPLLYTGWQCANLYADRIPYGEEARLEFIITDCGLGGHYGTVYIDDICTANDCKPAFGEVHLDVSNFTPVCPAFPFNVTGTFTAPQNINTTPPQSGTLTQMQLNIKQGGVVVTSLTNAVISGNTFSFPVTAANFTVSPATSPDGEYEYEAIGTFALGTNTYTANDDSANVGPDAIFEGCIPSPPCVEYLTITADVASPDVDGQMANIDIVASNTVNSGATALYHAQREVKLISDFDGLFGSTGHFYIQGCTDEPYTERAAPEENIPGRGMRAADLIPADKINGALLSVFPNPANDELNIIASQALKSVRLLSLDGKIVLESKAGESKHRISLSKLSKGVYILNAEFTNGEISSHKIIKQ